MSTNDDQVKSEGKDPGEVAGDGRESNSTNPPLEKASSGGENPSQSMPDRRSFIRRSIAGLASFSLVAGFLNRPARAMRMRRAACGSDRPDGGHYSDQSCAGSSGGGFTQDNDCGLTMHGGGTFGDLDCGMLEPGETTAANSDNDCGTGGPIRTDNACGMNNGENIAYADFDCTLSKPGGGHYNDNSCGKPAPLGGSYADDDCSISGSNGDQTGPPFPGPDQACTHLAADNPGG